METITLIYTDALGNQLRFTGDDIEHCHEQMLDFLNYNWELED